MTGRTGNIDTPFGYGGQHGCVYDKETGLYFLKSRYYDPATGRFTSRDRFKGFENRPASQNPYTYCENDPVNKVDPEGYAYLVFNGFRLVLYHTDDTYWRSWRAITGDPRISYRHFGGPIPPGVYRIRSANITWRNNLPWYRRVKYPYDSWGPGWILLEPIAGTTTYGRSGFYLHGGNLSRYTLGCIRVEDSGWEYIARLLPKLYGEYLNVYVRYDSRYGAHW